VATWKDVGRIVGQLPETAEASPRNWRVRKKLIVWERPLRKADYAALGDDAPDGDILGARVPDEGVKFALIAEDPDVYFTTPHFDGYPMVLARLAEIGIGELTELIAEAWLSQAPKTLVKAFLAERRQLLTARTTSSSGGTRCPFAQRISTLASAPQSACARRSGERLGRWRRPHSNIAHTTGMKSTPASVSTYSSRLRCPGS
jgi:hypothetical protein